MAPKTYHLRNTDYDKLTRNLVMLLVRDDMTVAVVSAFNNRCDKSVRGSCKG